MGYGMPSGRLLTRQSDAWGSQCCDTVANKVCKRFLYQDLDASINTRKSRVLSERPAALCQAKIPGNRFVFFVGIALKC